MTTPTTPFTIEDRVSILETHLEAVLPSLATKEDIADVRAEIARLAGKIDAMDAMNAQLNGKMDAIAERLEGRMDATNNRIDALESRLILKLGSAIAAMIAVAVAVLKFL